MFEPIQTILIIILSFFGILNILRTTSLMFNLPSKREKQVLLIFLNSQNADIELNSLVTRAKWDKALRMTKIIAVDCGIDCETAECCRKVISQIGNIELVKDMKIDLGENWEVAKRN